MSKSHKSDFEKFKINKYKYENKSIKAKNKIFIFL